VRLKVVSDQHYEFRDFSQSLEYRRLVHPTNSDNKADVCVIAGDLSPIGRFFTQRINEICEREEIVLYVPGNHDYYGNGAPDQADEALKLIEGAIPNLVVLRAGEVFEHKGQRFLGDTMWVRDTAYLRMTQKYISDAVAIQDFWDYMPSKNMLFEVWLKANLRKGDVVVTHHLPSDRSTPPFFKGAPTQPWFVCDMESLIAEREPALWIHGHTHSRCDYMLGTTRVFCNPVGYPSEHGRNLRNNLEPFIIELPDKEISDAQVSG
jgi:Icc-related predicted phosphoesterase